MAFFSKKKSNSGSKKSGFASNKALQRALGDYQVPKFPAIAMKAMKLLRDDRVSLHSVAQVIMSDPGISSSMLTMVNSAANAMRHPVNSVPQAAALLGRSQVESLLVSVAVGRALPSKSQYHDMGEFWRTAGRRASVASGFAAKLHPTTQSTSYTAGLLQDMAVPLLMESKKNEYATLYLEWQCGDGDIAVEERNRYQWTHAEVAGWICEEWNLPESLVSAITTHHETSADASVAEPAVYLVSLIRRPDDSQGVEQLVEYAVANYNMSSDECMAIVTKGFEQGDETAKLFR
ncbi:MAG: HDOD domain-containing protein [Kofleriaceae bacterium]|nr:HDOD domain-containing protein [Kofleriaceae bacterium]